MLGVFLKKTQASEVKLVKGILEVNCRSIFMLMTSSDCLG